MAWYLSLFRLLFFKMLVLFRMLVEEGVPPTRPGTWVGVPPYEKKSGGGAPAGCIPWQGKIKKLITFWKKWLFYGSIRQSM
jgi:hypothetical protein